MGLILWCGLFLGWQEFEEEKRKGTMKKVYRLSLVAVESYLLVV